MSITLVHLIGPVFFGGVIIISLGVLIIEIAAARHRIARALAGQSGLQLRTTASVARP